MNEKLRKILENHGIDVSVGSIEYWQNELEMALIEMYDEIEAKERKSGAEDYLKIMRDAVARERQACFELVYNHEDTYHHFGLCKRAAELIKQRGELAESKLEWQELHKDEIKQIVNDGEKWTAIEFAQAVSDLLREKNT